MLQKIREKISGWFAGVVIALLAGAFILWGVEFYFEQGSGAPNSVGTVNDVAITQNQVNQLVSQLQAQLSAKLGDQANTPQLMQQLKSYALESVVSQTALLTTFEKEGFHVSMTQIKAVIEQAPQFQVNGQFSEAKLMQAIYNMQMSPMEFFQQVQSRWIVNQVMQSVSTSAFVLPSEVNRLVALQDQQRAFGYFSIPSSLFLSKVVISDAAIKNNYTENQAVYETPEKVSVDYLVLSPDAIAKTITVTEQQAKQYYESHMLTQPSNSANGGGSASDREAHNNKVPSFDSIKNKIIALLQHQEVSKILSKQANQLSTLTYTNPDSLSAASKALNLPIQTSPLMTKSGEKTGIFANPKVIAAIFGHSVFESNNNSDPISLPDGTQIVLRIAKKVPSTPIPLSDVQAKIKQQLIEKQAMTRAGLLAYELQTKLIQGVNPQTLAKQNNLTWKTVPLISRDQQSAASKSIVAAAFAAPLKNPQTIPNANGFNVVLVSQVKNADAANATQAQTKTVSTQFSAVWTQLTQHCFVNSVMAGSKIVMKNQ